MPNWTKSQQYEMCSIIRSHSRLSCRVALISSNWALESQGVNFSIPATSNWWHFGQDCNLQARVKTFCHLYMWPTCGYNNPIFLWQHPVIVAFSETTLSRFLVLLIEIYLEELLRIITNILSIRMRISKKKTD